MNRVRVEGKWGSVKHMVGVDAWRGHKTNDGRGSNKDDATTFMAQYARRLPAAPQCRPRQGEQQKKQKPIIIKVKMKW